MEKRFYFGVAILVVFFILGMVVSVMMEQASHPIAKQLEQASQEAISGNLEQGILLARQAKKDWKAAWKGVAMVADHTPMDEIDSLFAQAEAYGSSQDQNHFSATCARLAELIEAVADAHKLSLWNLV